MVDLGEQSCIALASIKHKQLVVWAGAQLAAVLAHGHVLDTTLNDAGKATVGPIDHLSDPRATWPPEARDQLPGPVLYWVTTAIALAAAGAIVVGVSCSVRSGA